MPSECGESHLIVAQSNCTRYNGTWYNMTCFHETHAQYDEVSDIVNQTGKVELKSPSDEYFQ